MVKKKKRTRRRKRKKRRRKSTLSWVGKERKVDLGRLGVVNMIKIYCTKFSKS